VAATFRHDPSPIERSTIGRRRHYRANIIRYSWASLNDAAVTSGRFPATGATRWLTRSIPLCKQALTLSLVAPPGRCDPSSNALDPVGSRQSGYASATAHFLTAGLIFDRLK